MRSHPHASAWIAMSLSLAVCASCEDRTEWTRNADSAPIPEVDDRPLADEWPRGGPPRLWVRKLGPGYSGIVGRDGRLYTMHRAGIREVVVCLDARTGETVWEHEYDAPPVEGQDTDYGEGPNATPLLAEGRLCTIGFTGIMHCLDAATGVVLWSHDLWREFGGNVVELGYSSSPIEFEDTVIALVGGKGRSIMAFDKKDGRVVWKGLDFENSYSTPAIMRIHDRDQLVAFMATEAIGADPGTGELLWQYSIRNHYPQNICAPLRIDDDLVFVSTPEAGSRGLRLVEGDPFRVEEVWSTLRLQCFYTTLAQMGDYIYGSSGYSTAPIMTAIDARTGELAWRVRGFALAHVVAVGGRLIILDAEGELALATPGAEELTVHSKARVLTEPSRTPPTIVGNILYARDSRDIMALDLGESGGQVQ